MSWEIHWVVSTVSRLPCGRCQRRPAGARQGFGGGSGGPPQATREPGLGTAAAAQHSPCLPRNSVGLNRPSDRLPSPFHWAVPAAARNPADTADSSHREMPGTPVRFSTLSMRLSVSSERLRSVKLSVSRVDASYPQRQERGTLVIPPGRGRALRQQL